MLNDPFTLYELTSSGALIGKGDTLLIDVSPGKSVRVSNPFMGGKATLSISHSESKENKGQITDRSAVRFEVRRTLDDGSDVIAQATLTVSSPRNGFSAAEVLAIAHTLLGSLHSDGGVFSDAYLRRVLAGEP